MTEEIETQENNKLPVLRGELELLVVVLINSLGVVLMLYSGSGISAISSVPYAFSEVFNKISLGTWTYIFQGLLVLSLMIMRKKFVAPYLFSFVVGFAFSEMLDVHEMWIGVLPTAIGYRVLYFIISYLLLCIGIALSNRCGRKENLLVGESVQKVASLRNVKNLLSVVDVDLDSAVRSKFDLHIQKQSDQNHGHNHNCDDS